MVTSYNHYVAARRSSNSADIASQLATIKEVHVEDDMAAII